MAKNTTLKTRIQNRHDTEANWTTASNATNPFVPLKGEVIVYDPDTTYTTPRVKIGDGVTRVGNLAFVGGDISKYVTLDTTQVITGDKTFNGSVVMKGVVFKAGPETLSIKYSDGWAIEGETIVSGVPYPGTIYFPDGDGTLALTSDIPTNCVTTDTEQTISGNKTFSKAVSVSTDGDAGFEITGGGNTWKINARTEEGPLNIVGQGAAGANTYQFPNKSGTIALTDDVPSVPSNILIYDYTFDTTGKNLSYPLMIAKNPSSAENMTRIDEGSITFRDLSRNNSEGTTQLVVAQVNNSDPVVVSLPSSSGELALKSDIPSTDNFVTLASAQNITGAKTFKSNLIVGTPSANSVTLSSNGIISNFQGVRGFDIDPSNFYIQAQQYGAYQRLKFSTSLGVLAADTHTIDVPVTNGTMLTTGNTKTIGGQSIEGSGDIQLYPIGSIYISTDSTSPSSLFGGIWEQIKDVFLLAAGDTYTGGSTGGSADAVVVEHEHKFATFVASEVGGAYSSPATANNYSEIRQSADTNTTGVSGAGKNMPPYLVVYMWKRIA